MKKMIISGMMLAFLIPIFVVIYRKYSVNKQLILKDDHFLLVHSPFLKPGPELTYQKDRLLSVKTPLDLSAFVNSRKLEKTSAFLFIRRFDVPAVSAVLRSRFLVDFGPNIPDRFYLNEQLIYDREKEGVRTKLNILPAYLKPGRPNEIKALFLQLKNNYPFYLTAALQDAVKAKPALDFGPFIRTRNYQSVQISWSSSKRATGMIHYSTDGVRWKQTPLLVPKKNNSVLIKKLQPGRKYFYSYQLGLYRTRKSYFFNTIPNPRPKNNFYKFLVIGDDIGNEKLKSAVISETASDPVIRFVVYTGNIKKDPHDHLWHIHYFKRIDPIFRYTVLYAVKGVTAQKGFPFLPFNHKDGYYRLHRRERDFEYRFVALNTHLPLTARSEQFQWAAAYFPPGEYCRILAGNGDYIKQFNKRYPHVMNFIDKRINVFCAGGVGQPGLTARGKYTAVVNLSLSEGSHTPVYALVRVSRKSIVLYLKDADQKNLKKIKIKPFPG